MPCRPKLCLLFLSQFPAWEFNHPTAPFHAPENAALRIPRRSVRVAAPSCLTQPLSMRLPGQENFHRMRRNIRGLGHTGLLMEGNRCSLDGDGDGVRGGGPEAVPPLLQGPLPTRKAFSQAREQTAPPVQAIPYTEHFCGFCFTGVSRMPLLDGPETVIKTTLPRSARGTGNVSMQRSRSIFISRSGRGWVCLWKPRSAVFSSSEP